MPIEGEFFFDKESIIIKKGTTCIVSATMPEGSTPSSFTWLTSDAEVATVDKDGVITALKTGYAMIAAVSPDGSLYDYLQLDVVSYDTEITSLSFESDALSIAIGATKDLKVTYQPAGAPLSNFVFKVEDPTLLSVSPEGQMTALK
jgi:uncharacterized protein YjdB